MRNIEEYSFEELVEETIRLSSLLKERDEDLAKSYEMVLKEKEEYACLLVKHNRTLKVIDELEKELKKNSNGKETNEEVSSRLMNRFFLKNMEREEIEMREDKKLKEFQALRKLLSCKETREDYINELKKRVHAICNSK